jgi:ABC-2 type transport system ATP-binding protein
VIDVDQLCRVYCTGSGSSAKEIRALDRLSLQVSGGETHGLLGPNGAGKTTLVKILSTVLTPTSGTARVAGADVVRQPKIVRTRIGLVLGGDRGLYTRLSARQNLHFWGAAARLDRRSLRRRTDELLDRLGLAEWADQPVETFSRGMKQRVHLARGLVGDPDLLILDEPTAGLDPVACREFRNLVRSLRADGKTMLIATHDMIEAEQLCDRVTLVDRGQAIFCESTREVGHLLGGDGRVEFVDDDPWLPDLVRAVSGVVDVTPDGDGRWVVTLSSDSVAAVLSLLAEKGVRDIASRPPTLEQVYVRYLGDRGLSL